MVMQKKFNSKVDFNVIKANLFLNYKKEKPEIKLELFGDELKASKEDLLINHSDFGDIIFSNLKKRLQYDKIDFIDIKIDLKNKSLSASVYYLLEGKELKTDFNDIF